MNNCKVCGQPCGIYEICRECEKDVQNKKVIKCNKCGEYYFSEQQCSCNAEKEYSSYFDYEYDRSNETSQNHTKKNQGGFKKAFEGTFGAGCGCFTFIFVLVIILIFALTKIF